LRAGDADAARKDVCRMVNKNLLLVLVLACGGAKPVVPAPEPPAPEPVAEPTPIPAPQPAPAPAPHAPPPKIAADVAFLDECRLPLGNVKASIDNLIAVQGKRSVANTLEPFNEISRVLDNASEWAQLMSEVHPDPKLREAARTCEQEVQKIGSDLLLDRRLFEALKVVDTKGVDAETKRFFAQTLRDFRRAGVDRDDKQRARLEEIDDQITQLGQQFQKAIAEDTRRVTVKDKARLAGLPADWIAQHTPDASGAITISTDYPDYIPVQTYADDDALRKELFVAFRSRGDAHNEEVLAKVLALRAEKSHVLGFANWADYESDDKMLRGGKAARLFIDRVQKLATKRSKRDYAELLAERRKREPKAKEVTEWQKSYLETAVKRTKYAVDSGEVRKYFAYDRVLAGLLDITSKIYEIEYVPTTDPRVWSPDVQAFDVMRKGDKLGRIFLDMHPRDGKYKHAAQFTITTGVTGVQLPEGALVCNLPSGSELMDHGDVVTMFHELGHLMHHVLGGHHHWLRQSGVATERDFVEAPSQMFEEWAWSYETLSRFAKHVDTGAVIPKDLVEKMRRADRFGKGTWAVQQLLYAAISLRFHQMDPAKLDQLAVVKQMQTKYTPFPFVEGTKLHTSFGHLIGYSSMYYTYMWSLVIAKDLLTAFDKKGLMATDVTGAYRDKVLAGGGTKDAADLVKDFLGRPYNFKAFEKYLSE
jgi:thimet oligopeptidase